MKINFKTGAVFLLITITAILLGWNKWGSTTKIALINYQPYQAATFALSNKDKLIKYELVDLDHLDQLKKYDFVLGFGMGLKLNEEQRNQLQGLADKGFPLYLHSVTNPANDIIALDSTDYQIIKEYLSNGNKTNYQNMAYYIRKNIDKKKLFVSEPSEPVENVTDVYFHINDEVSFEKISDYESYLRKEGFFREGADRVAIVAGIHDPFSGNKAHIDSLISSLQNSGLNVYPIVSGNKKLDFLEEIDPSAVIFFPAGRLMMAGSDRTVDWLKSHNIPLFTPITLLKLEEEWVNDPMGMFGGFMGQTVVIPELDGSIVPYALVAQEKDKDGLFRFKAMPDRLKNFTEIVNNFIALKHKVNADKKVAVYYVKGEGQSSPVAQGLETTASLYNLLKSLKSEGYQVDGLPDSYSVFEKFLQQQGVVLNPKSEGAIKEYYQEGKPIWVKNSDYLDWVGKSLPISLYKEVRDKYGEAPGTYMSRITDGDSFIAVSAIRFGNIALLPQPLAALGEDDFSVSHGVKSPPPHPYIASYLWMQYGFKADALIHFGTHGSLEFTPQKQVALGSYDWPDRLTGTIPHFYYYTIANIGESMMAKRRTYATTVSYLSPAFSESNTRSKYKNLDAKIHQYFSAAESAKAGLALDVKKLTVEMGLHRDLRLDSLLSQPYNDEEIELIENFAEEIANEKMNGQLYTFGETYSADKIKSTVMAMSVDPIAYSLAALDKLNGKINDSQLKRGAYFTKNYLDRAKAIFNKVWMNADVNDLLITQMSGLSQKDLDDAREVMKPPLNPFEAMMSRPGSSDKKNRPGTQAGVTHDNRPEGRPGFDKKDTAQPGQSPVASGIRPGSGKPQMTGSRIEYSNEQKQKAVAITEIEKTISNIDNYRKGLLASPTIEIRALINALNGGYTSPSSGGDAVANPASVPTGHNMFSVNPETTPSQSAWGEAKKLVDNTLSTYQKKHGEYPRKVSYTFWSGEFIETEGVTIAQVLYMLGVEPVWDTFGRVSDIRLIDSKELNRPRIDVVVQTSGQFRDLGASRLMLISRAVQMASGSNDDGLNLVATSTVDIERQLVEQGMSPKKAREASTQRIFGGTNGMYGTGIQNVIKSSDRWESDSEIADAYLSNMGAVYGGSEDWGEFQEGLFRAVLKNTDVVVQPRQNNTWGALSLDHVYEFMGGLNLTIRNITGKDPDAFLADYRNRNNFKMQDLKEAIGVESRATILNPAYVKEVMKGKSGSAAQITDVVTNTFGWSVTRPEVIEKQLWDGIYDTYVEDINGLGVQQFFRNENPAALQEMTAVMLESARKGLWKANARQIAILAQLHAGLVEEFGSAGTTFSSGNLKLQEFINQQLSADQALQYQQKLNADKMADVQQGMVLKKEEVSNEPGSNETGLNGVLIAGVVFALFIIMLVILRRKRKAVE